MALSRIIKRVSKKRRHTYNNNNRSSSTACSVKTLPKDLLVEVAATVASNSFTDLHSMKLCCKDFLDAAEDNRVFQRVSLDKFPLIPWRSSDKELSFLMRCMESQNLESLYRKGLRECLEKGSTDGLGVLKVAAQRGHKEAKYVYGMFLLRSQDEELVKEGLEHLRFLRKSRCIVRTRNKAEQLARYMWMNNILLVPRHKPICAFKSTCKGWRLKKGRWVFLDDDNDDCDDVNSCENCRWDHELELFHELFNIHEVLAS